MYGSNKVQVVETMCRTGQGHERRRVEKSPQRDASQGHIASQLMYYAVAPRYAVSWRLETLLTRAVISLHTENRGTVHTRYMKCTCLAA